MGALTLVGRTLIILLMLCPIWFFQFCLYLEKEAAQGCVLPWGDRHRGNGVLVFPPGAQPFRGWAGGLGTVTTCAASLLGADEH